MLPHINPYIDPGQYGGLKGSSVVHYLVRLLHFVHERLDSKEPHAVVLLLLDLSKAYNRGSPSYVLEDLFAMHCPGYILSLVALYLSGRTMRLKFNSSWSKEISMPASFSQGCFLMMILFIVQFNGAVLRPSIPRLSFLPAEESKRLSVKLLMIVALPRRII